MKLKFVTGNEHKYQEVVNFFEENRIDIDCENIDLDLIEPQWDTIEAVAEYKVKNAHERVRGSIFIEDAGFFVEKLNGFPGVYSSYCHRAIGNEGILNLLCNFKNFRDRKAHFKSVIAVKFEDNPDVQIFKGIVNGTVAQKIRGNEGFGFDPIFIADEKPNYTFAELKTEEKNEISHRSKAISQLAQYIKENYN